MLESTKLALPEEMAGENQLLTRAIAGLNDTIRDVRNYILDLRPRRFDGDLEKGLARLAREFQANTLVAVTLTIEAEVSAVLPAFAARTLFLTTQEALANVARHACASQVEVDLKRIGSGVQMTISDDGQGFEPLHISRTMGHGLSNMQIRAKSFNGSFKLQSTPGQGTSITVIIPSPQSQ